jgi:hypothetical protein
MKSDSAFVTKEQLALELNVSVACINKWITQKKITPVYVGKRAMLPSNTTIPARESRLKEVVNE